MMMIPGKSWWDKTAANPDTIVLPKDWQMDWHQWSCWWICRWTWQWTFEGLNKEMTMELSVCSLLWGLLSPTLTTHWKKWHAKWGMSMQLQRSYHNWLLLMFWEAVPVWEKEIPTTSSKNLINLMFAAFPPQSLSGLSSNRLNVKTLILFTKLLLGLQLGGLLQILLKLRTVSVLVSFWNPNKSSNTILLMLALRKR